MTRVSLQRSSDALHAPRRSPPLPPLRKGGKGDDHLRKEGQVGGVWSFFPPLRRGGRGGAFECLCVVPGLASRQLRITLVCLAAVFELASPPVRAAWGDPAAPKTTVIRAG